MIVLGSGGIVLKVRDILVNPEVPLLLPEHGAQWIRIKPWDGLRLHGEESYFAAFRTEFTIDSAPQKALLHVRPFRYAAVFLDGAYVGQTDLDISRWRQRFTFDLAQVAALTPGKHELMISVVNRLGPPAVLAYCDELGISTNTRWKTRDQKWKEWAPALAADAPVKNDIGEIMERADRVFLGMWEIFIPVFLIVVWWTLAMERSQGPPPWLRRITPTASGFRWLLLFGWAILGANNICKIPYAFGFDVPNHMDYIEYVARKWSVPYATEGWQMFQSPLYYLLSAPLYALFSAVSVTKAPEALRIVPLLCGALQIQLCYCVVRRVYRKRDDLQALGTLLGGYLPINIYQSQYLGNEPLAAVFCSAVILVSIMLLQEPEKYWSPSTFTLMGLLVGLGLLTKVTDLLICGPLGLVILYAGFRRGLLVPARISNLAGMFGIVFGVAFLVCGWYFLRNWAELGYPFVGGWDKSRGYIWWQEPGYRTISQYLRFGEAVLYPFYSSSHGLWDGLYSTLWIDGYVGCADLMDVPYWNLNFMQSCVWLSLLPTAILVIGVATTLLRPVQSIRGGQALALVCLMVYLAAIAMMTLRIPSYSTLKGSYMLGIVCSFAILGAQGFEIATRTRAGRTIVYGGMACWALAVYASYFVVWTTPYH